MPLRASRRLHRAAHRDLRQARHPRHLVRARLGRLPARAPGAQPEAATRTSRRCAPSPKRPSRMVREYKGSHSGEHGDGLVRSEFNEPMFGPRIVARLRGGQGPLRSGRPAQSRQDRATRRRWMTARCSAIAPDYRGAELEDGARLVGLSRRRRRFPGRGRDVQQQRRLPQARRRRDVPVLPRHPRREATSRAAAPTRCGWRSPASSGRMRSPPTRWWRR